jgi:Ca2+-binding RTX toxin-like protein
MKLVGSSGDDGFTFNATATLTTADTIDGNAGSDTIFLNNNTSSVDGTGNALAGGSQVTFGANTKGIEKIVVVDLAADFAGDVDIAISNGYTDTSLTIDGSVLDVDSTAEATGETLKVVSSDTNTALTVLGGAGQDTITGGGAGDSIVGGGAYDSLTGGGGNDTIEGGAGADTILGGAGADNISGGAGNDAINVTTFTDFKTSGGVETVDGGAGTDSLNFAQNVVLTLTAPELSKLIGIETITMVTTGNAANLTFGNETFTSLGAPSLALVSNTGSGVTTIDGSAVSNGSFLIINDIGADTADKYVGGSGDDIFRFDGTAGLKANDTVTGNGGSDSVQLDASAGAVTAVLDLDTTSVENVVVYAGATGVEAGAVTLQLGEHSVAALNAYTSAGLTIDMSAAVNPGVAGAIVNFTESSNVAGVDNDNEDITGELIKAPLTITGTSKADTLMGSAGNDTIIGNSTLTNDIIVGGDGNDTLSSGSGADQLGGGVGNDNLSSGGGNDTLFGAAGNDILDAGDGTDRIDGEGGLDNITTGLGNDTVVYDAASDSSGSLKDIITDFTQSTLNATTGETTAAGDNIEINFGTIGNNVNTWALSDKGDVENGGLAAAAIDGVMGSFVFADDTSTIYLDYNGDGFLNTADLQITVSGLSSFHSNDINAIVTAGTGGDTLTGGSGDDKLTGGSGADSLYGGFGNDTIAGAAGGDKIYGQGGNDVLSNTGGADSTIDGGAGDDTLSGSATNQMNLTGGTGDDIFDLQTSTVQANRETITDFEDAGAVVGDIIKLDGADTTDATADGSAPVFATASVAAANGAPVAIVGTPASNAFDVLEVTIDSGTAVLASDFVDAGTGANLLKNLGAANNETATGFTVTGEHSFFIIAYDAGNAYIYAAVNGANDTLMEPAAIKPLAIVTGVTAGSFIADDFLLA